MLSSHYFLRLVTDFHNQLLFQSTEMTTHRLSFTLVCFTAQDSDLIHTVVQMHINILIPR